MKLSESSKKEGEYDPGISFKLHFRYFLEFVLANARYNNAQGGDGLVMANAQPGRANRIKELNPER